MAQSQTNKEAHGYTCYSETQIQRWLRQAERVGAWRDAAVFRKALQLKANKNGDSRGGS